jgi:hypothetical protein
MTIDSMAWQKVRDWANVQGYSPEGAVLEIGEYQDDEGNPCVLYSLRLRGVRVSARKNARLTRVLTDPCATVEDALVEADESLALYEQDGGGWTKAPRTP